ncbi:MAG TPA: AraC family transcriptional regulator [Ramlibacter sp.]|nr:AraC family transcriptional regulator [Ramlibacter sp.]
MTTALPEADDAPATAIRQVGGSLADFVTGLVAVHGDFRRPRSMLALPTGATVVHVHFGGNDRHPQDVGTSLLSGIRGQPASRDVAGPFMGVFALLTPLGALQLTRGQATHGLADCIRLDAVLDGAGPQALSQAARLDTGLNESVERVGRWLETWMLGRRPLPPAALRTATVCTDLMRNDGRSIESLASSHAITRRQLERDMRRWMNTTPKGFSHAVRLQHACRLAGSGARLSDVAAGAGYADQAHMTRAFRQLTHMTPREFLQMPPTPISAAFSRADAGGRPYA